ncbi:glycosyltransferase family 32 protein [Acrodontium crateriforme]|uniref:Glycosyltransferase family 32 protein n=1 Tax=Acrodontium crateriforme TaxID=150365 RepID=A0AAQ3M908_9PEZI|nr:glycosyltransferase family 32 protein [Acrodontium crateriforme]
MLTFRRALIGAAVVLTFFLLLHSTHSPQPESILTHSPKPTGSYQDNRKIVDGPPPPPEPPAEPKKPETKSEGQVALAKKIRPQIPLEDLQVQPLRKQLAYAFPYDPESKFPAYIWQTWKRTPAAGDFGEEFRASEASWTQLHPSFVHEVLTDDVAQHLIRVLYATVPEVVEAYNALPQPVMKADFFRYLILLARGGIYTDIDTTALKSAVDWVPTEVSRSTYGLVIGIEADPDRPDWADWYSRRIQFCQWTIQSKPGHPVLVDIVASITEEALRRKATGELDEKHMKSVVEFTGPALWTDAIFKFFNNPEFFDMSTSKGNITWQQFTGIKQAKKVGDVVVLPITSFSPGVQQMGAGDDDDPMAFVKHAFEGTWKPESERHIGEQPAEQ